MASELGNDKTALLVAAIDFGTTYSGWGFSFRHEFDSDPTKVCAKNWTGGQLVSLKGPTCVLIKPDGKTLDSFGFDAETKYAALADDGEHTKYYYFKRFKMMLHGKIGIQRHILLRDATEKELEAKTVFSLAIKYLKDDMLAMSKQRLSDGGFQPDEIHWVLTVPAIWNDAAKQFMREAAEAAGIKGHNLTIALEPEAASLYCRHLPVERNVGSSASLASFKPGTRYLILDCGGGTVDITVHEVVRGGQLKELHKASGGAWGGTRVDDAFYQFLVKLFGGPIMKKFIRDHMDDYIDICRDFEIKKRDIGPGRDDKVTMRIPIALTDLFSDETGETIKELIPQTPYAGKMTVTGDKMRIEGSVVRQFFQESIDSILNHVDKLLKEPETANCGAIVMVGGFSESPLLQDAVKKKFPKTRVIIPHEAGLAVLKGAVIFGHKPTIIAERVSKFTYGVACQTKFVQGKHPSARKTTDDEGNDVVYDAFSKHVRVGETLQTDAAQSENTYQVAKADQKYMTVRFYATTNPCPMFVDEKGCHMIGVMQVECPGYGKDREAVVSLKFGSTEIEASAKIKHTGQVTKAKINFLG